MCPGDLAPDNPDLGTPNLARRAVNESDLLAQVEICGLGVVDALKLNKTCVGVVLALGTLITQVAALHVESVVLLRRHCDGFSEQQRATQTSRKKAEVARKKSVVVVRIVVASNKTKSGERARNNGSLCKCRTGRFALAPNGTLSEPGPRAS